MPSIDPSHEQFRALLALPGDTGPIEMLNLLRFRDAADYPDVAAFVRMVSDPGYQAIVVHRQAALADSRLILTVKEPGAS